jgi:hypothetical protein
VFWVDLENVDLGPSASPMRLEVDPEKPMAGEVSANFQKTEPFAWLK